jgi:hypothetical protein
MKPTTMDPDPQTTLVDRARLKTLERTAWYVLYAGADKAILEKAILDSFLESVGPELYRRGAIQVEIVKTEHPPALHMQGAPTGAAHYDVRFQLAILMPDEPETPRKPAA